MYGFDQRYLSSLPFIVNPFQIQSIVPEDSSLSFASQSIGCFTSVQLFLLHTSCARSKSNPTYSPLSSLYPYGGNSESNPTTNTLSFGPVFPFVLITPVNTSTAAIIAISTITPAIIPIFLFLLN